MTTNSSFRKVLNFIFVIFSLYLLGDVFYRWDGFRYYASLSDFLPSVALVALLWSGVALFAAMLIWLPFKVYELSPMHLKWKITIEHLLLFLLIFVFIGTTAWFIKKTIWPYETTTYQFKRMLIFTITFMSIFLSWIFRNKSKRWIGIIQERITFLVWLFGIFVILSVPIVAYHTWWKQADKTASQEIRQSSAAADTNRPNIILITFDALTARDMSVYGYERQTTPFITEWAKDATVFTRLQAESNYTAPTTASLMTGKRVWTHQLFQPYGFKPLKSDIENLPLVMKRSGYYNMAFVVNPIASVKALGVDGSFDIAYSQSEFSVPSTIRGIANKLLYQLFGENIRQYDWIISSQFILGRLLYSVSYNYSNTSKTEVPPEIAFNRFLDVMDDNIPEPFFAWIHLYLPHDPYLPPEPYIGMFDSSSELLRLNEQEKLYRFKYQDYPEKLQPTVNILRARYDEFIRYCDSEFEHFMKELSRREILNNTIIILSSDHGESFEHNYLMHGYSHLYEQATHIPLIIKKPGQGEGMLIDELIEQVDVPATILDLANAPIPSWMEGRSVVPLMYGNKIPNRAIFSMNFEKNPSRGSKITKGTIAVWEGDYKLIHYLSENKSLLFNLKQDPDELNNLFNKEAETGQRLLRLIKDNLKKANKSISRKREI